MKKILISVLFLFIISTQLVFGYTYEEEEKFKENLKNKIESEVHVKGYGNLVIDRTFDIEKVTFGLPNKLYDFEGDKSDSTLKFNNKYILRADYNGKEIANIYYTQGEDGNLFNIFVVLNYADRADDVILDNVYNFYYKLDKKEYICIYHNNESNVPVTVAFLLNEDRINIITDRNGIFNDYFYENLYSRYITKEDFIKAMLNEGKRVTTNDMLIVIFLVSIVGLILNLFILFAHHIERLPSKKNKKIVEIHKSEETRIHNKVSKNKKK